MIRVRVRIERLALSSVSLAALLLVATRARAGDAGELDGAPVRVDITESSNLNYHFDNRNDQSLSAVEQRIDDNYGEWLNRFNVTASWKSFQAGVRLDTATYFHRPKLEACAPGQAETAHGCFSDLNGANAENKLAYRYRNTYLISPGLPSKFYLTYAKPWLEVTAGDGYVSFGRGLVLAMRKIDELAADTTLQGGKIVARVKPFTITLAVGLSNPVRVDEATGVTLRDDAPSSGSIWNPATNSFVSWSRDLIAGGRIETKLDTVTIGVQAADIHRRMELTSPATASPDPAAQSKDIQNVGFSIAAPKISDLVPLNVYAEVAVQNRVPFESPSDDVKTQHGYAAYGSLSMTTGIVTNALEFKHYRAYYPVKLNMDFKRFGGAGAFATVQYNSVPTLETVTQDSLFDNSCTTGARARSDVKVSKSLLAFASVGVFDNWGEVDAYVCGVGPGLGFTATGRSPMKTTIVDMFTGFELRSQHDSSYALVTFGTRQDRKEDKEFFYREGFVQFDLVKTVTEMFSLELSGWHRNRFELGETWREGETYLGVKYTSLRSVFFGHEYTTRESAVKPGAFLESGGVQHFLNVGLQNKFSDAVSLKVFAGQQRGALKCVSGVCRVFPPFEGAKAELVVRY
jgi:hypothetical protein